MPSKRTPNMSHTSRSSQFAIGQMAHRGRHLGVVLVHAYLQPQPVIPRDRVRDGRRPRTEGRLLGRKLLVVDRGEVHEARRTPAPRRPGSAPARPAGRHAPRPPSDLRDARPSRRWRRRTAAGARRESPRAQYLCACVAILSWSFMSPSMTDSGRGGQPGNVDVDRNDRVDPCTVA